MSTEEKKRRGAKHTAALSAVALLAAASLTVNGMFTSPAAILTGDETAVVCTATDADDEPDAGPGETETEKVRRRTGVRERLRAAILRLPLIVRLTAVVPLWAVGWAVTAAAGALWTAAEPLLGRLLGFAVLLAALIGVFALSGKAIFPDLPLRKILNRRSLLALLIGAAALTLFDAAAPLVWEEYAGWKRLATAGGTLLLSLGTAGAFALREQRKRLAPAAAETAAAEPEGKPELITFTDGTGTYTIRVPHTGGID